MTYLRYCLLFFLLSVCSSCIDLVDEGLEVRYEESDADLTVEAITSENGAIGETISYKITVSSGADIKSCIVQHTKAGQNGSGFNISSSDFDDPFIDHIFGTVQKGIRSFTVRYDYIIPEDAQKNRMTVTIIDESGKVSVETAIEVVPGVTVYNFKKLHALNNDFNDAFASVDGMVYADIKTNYSALTEENLEVQKKIDILFYYDKGSKRSVLAAPSSNRLGLDLNIENQTLFKKLPLAPDLDLNELSPARLIELTQDANLLQDGRAQIDNIIVGDVIGFITDLNALFSLKTGMLKVTGLHPASVPQYAGVSYVLECDIIVQK